MCNSRKIYAAIGKKGFKFDYFYHYKTNMIPKKSPIFGMLIVILKT